MTILIEKDFSRETLKGLAIAELQDAVEAGAAGAFANGTGTNSVFGPGAVDPTGADAFATGTGSAAGAGGFASGTGMQAGPMSFAQGTSYAALVGATGSSSFAQGYGNLTAGSYSFTQGGFNENQGDNCFVQGLGIYVTNPASTSSLFQGDFLSFSGLVKNSLIQGAGMTSTGLLVYGLIQGRGHTLGADVRASFLQGDGHDCSSSDSFLQGRRHTIGTNSSHSFAQGADCTINGFRAFARGHFVHVPRDDQTTFGSNRLVLGAAQTGWITKHIQTSDAVQATLVTIDLEEDKAYSLVGNVVARNTDTDDEVASFVVSQALAYRDAAGAAVLIGSPVALTRVDSGGGSAAWLADLAQSGNNVLLRVTGDALDDVEWCARLDFTEVKG